MIFRNILFTVFLWWGKKGCFYLYIFFLNSIPQKSSSGPKKKSKKKPSIGRYWYRPKAGKKKTQKKSQRRWSMKRDEVVHGYDTKKK